MPISGVFKYVLKRKPRTTPGRAEISSRVVCVHETNGLGATSTLCHLRISSCGHLPVETRLGSIMSNMTMRYVSVAPQVQRYIALSCTARSRRRQALRATRRTCCSAQTDSTKSPRKHVRANGLNFVVDDHGDTSATPVILLHGFPNSANVWERQVYNAVLSALCMQQVIKIPGKSDLVCRFRLW